MVYKNETVTIAATSVGFTAANLALARSLYGREVKQATCTLEAGQIRAWEDGTAPTTTVGQIINIGDVFIVGGDNASAFRAIRTGSTSGKISVAYEV